MVFSSPRVIPSVFKFMHLLWVDVVRLYNVDASSTPRVPDPPALMCLDAGQVRLVFLSDLLVLLPFPLVRFAILGGMLF